MNHSDDEFVRRIRRQAERVGRGRRTGIWRDLGSAGMMGWMIAGPTVIGALAGRWLDRRAESGVFWTLSLLVLGLTAGCLSAWRHARREIGP
jgi:ATP synthase protein I